MLKLRSVLVNSKAAIDLASIMVGIIVIGLIGGVIAATVFAVIPWAQDNAAKEQLQSIHTAQNAAFGLSADPSRELTAGQERNSFTNSAGLEKQGLLAQGETYCTVNEGADNYLAYAKSSSGKIWVASNENKSPEIATEELSADCTWLGEPTMPEVPGVPSIPNPPVQVRYENTQMLLNCPTALSSVYIPIRGAQGDLVITRNTDNKVVYETTLTNQSGSNGHQAQMNFAANTDYTVTFNGSFKLIQAIIGNVGGLNQAQVNCYRGFPAIGTDSGVTQLVFQGMTNLVQVPESIPTTVSHLSDAFRGASSFNQDISNWDVSNVTGFSGMFAGAYSFNQHLEGWELNNAVGAAGMFQGLNNKTIKLNNWTVHNSDLSHIFAGTTNLTIEANNWKISGNNTIMTSLLRKASTPTIAAAINPTIQMNNWTISNNGNFNFFLNGRTTTILDVSNISMQNWKFIGSPKVSYLVGYTNFNQNINNWDVSGLYDTTRMFEEAKQFNQPLNEWDTKNMTVMALMFYNASSYNQNISNWDVSKITNSSSFATGAVNFTEENKPKFKK